MSKVGLAILLVFCVAAVLAPPAARHQLGRTFAPLQPPSVVHPLGTDDIGRDLLAQVLAGARVSLLVGLSAGLAATLLGGLVGLAAGYFGGSADRLLMRLVDFFLAIPRLPLLIVLAAYLGSGIWVIVIAFVFISWAYPARMVRAQVLLEKRRAYVTAAQLSGLPWHYILRRHIAPPLLPLLAAVVIMEMGHAVAAEAGLSFLGLGDPTAVSWGTILYHAFAYPALFLDGSWLWWALPAGLCLSLVLLGLALVSVSLEGNLDPRLKGRRLGP